MSETLEIPDGLEACQRMLREVLAANHRLQEINAELLDTCTSVQDSHLKLEQHRDELEQTIRESENLRD